MLLLQKDPCTILDHLEATLFPLAKTLDYTTPDSKPTGIPRADSIRIRLNYLHNLITYVSSRAHSHPSPESSVSDKDCDTPVSK
jgi:hypothetical protein